MSLSFNLIENQRREARRARRQSRAQATLISLVGACVVLVALCAGFAWVFYGFIFL